jgi:GNAT superfamily N-acetyltransferase
VSTAPNFEISEESIRTLDDYGTVSIAFDIKRFLDLVSVNYGLGGFLLRERPVNLITRKDYDSIAGQSPADWPKRFDVSSWGQIVARSNGQRVGGAVIAFNSPGVLMLEGRRDIAVLWDIRVEPRLRGCGIGSALFRAVESWASARTCRRLKVETQNVNVDACGFYARQGCYLALIDRYGYAELPDEIKFVWCKDLAPSRATFSRGSVGYRTDY